MRPKKLDEKLRGFSKPEIELASEREHEHWMDYLLLNGWKSAEKTDKTQKLNEI